MNRGFFDIHCHILPGMDDGASTIDEALRMLEMAKADGIKAIVATPHIMDGIYDNTKDSIEDSVSKLGKLADGIKLYTGADIRICHDLVRRVIAGNLPLINNKNYMLLELPEYGLPPLGELGGLVSALKMKGITPVITHPERNMFMLKDTAIMERLLRHGAFFQVTAMSITKKLGGYVQKSVFSMIKNGLVHAVATDAHNTKDRPPVLSDAYMKVLKKFDDYTAWKLFEDNPLKIINGREVD